MPDTEALLIQALNHLAHAVAVAEATDVHFAEQIRLAAATLPCEATWYGEPAEPDCDVATRLLLALDCLDLIAPLSGPSDLQLCAWHIHELHRMATGAGTAS
jgi:hypothetical protein